MSLKDAVIRSVAAENDQDRRMRLAAAMLSGQDTDILEETYLHAMNLVYGKVGSNEERTAARIVIEMLALALLARVEAQDSGIEGLLDEVVALEFGACQDSIDYDSEEGFSVLLDADPNEVPETHDLALDVWADTGSIHLSMRVVTDGGVRLSGSLDLEGVAELRRGLYLATSDAERRWEHVDQLDEADD